MADIRLIIFAVIMSVFSIASNSILITKERSNKDALNDNEYKFAIASLAGSIIVLMAAIYFGFKGESAANYRG